MEQDTSHYNVHDHLQGKPFDELIAINMADRLPFAVCLCNIKGELNTGIMIRTANIMGAEKVFIYGHRRYDRRSTVGSHRYIPIEYVEDVEAFHKQVSEIYTPLFLEPQHSRDIRDLYPTGIQDKVCLVFGNEGTGIPQDLLDAYNKALFIRIPQRGVIRSMNVSSAASIAMWIISQKYQEL